MSEPMFDVEQTIKDLTQTIDFMRKLDVKEIHGYDANLGLKLISPSVLGTSAKPEEPTKKVKPAVAAT